MGDGNPFPAKFVAYLHRVAKLRLQVFEIGFSQIVDRGAILDHLMSFLFEEGKERLAHNGGISIIHLAEEHIAAHTFIRLGRQELINQQHLTKGRGGLCQR